MRPVRLDDLTDSRLVYERTPPPVGLGIIAVVLLALVATVMWAALTPKPSVVHATGSVEAVDRTTVSSTVSGTVEAVLAPTGSPVTTGDVILRLSSSELELETQSTEAQLAAAREALELQQRFTAAVEDGTNDFDRADPEESQHYYAFDVLEKQKAQLRVDTPSMEALGYSPDEIVNARSKNEEKADEITSSALATSAQAVAELQRQVDTLETKVSALSGDGGPSAVVAAGAGEIYLARGVRAGTVVSAGTPLGSITPHDSPLVVRVYVSVPNRELVSVGDPVTVTALGLPSANQHRLDGVVAAIDADVTDLGASADPSASGGSVAYGVTVELPRYSVPLPTGTEHALTNGSSVKAELVYDQITYLEYAAQLMGLA